MSDREENRRVEQSRLEEGKGHVTEVDSDGVVQYHKLKNKITLDLLVARSINTSSIPLLVFAEV